LGSGCIQDQCSVRRDQSEVQFVSDKEVQAVLRNVFILCLFITGLSGCGGGGSEPSPVDNNKDRQAILQHWADDIIIPSYGDFKIKFDAMVTKADAFAASPTTTTLIEFRNAWSEAYAQWQHVEIFEFGPADRYTLRNFFNIYPADVAGISANISNPSVNLDLPSEYSRQGFPALDYLLNGVAASDTDIVTFYTSSSEGTTRVAYVKRLITRMNSLITTVISEWNGSYKDSFISKTGLDASSSFGLVVNSYVLHYERYIRSGKFGIPSGATIAGAGVPHADKVEAVYKRDISLTLAKNAHNAALKFFSGKGTIDGPSLNSYLDALGAKDAGSGTLLSEIIVNQFADITSKLNALSPNLYSQVQTNNQPMVDVYTSMQKLVRILKVDMTSAMSVTITYTDNDGD
jgi:predicted lipoprotein